MYLCLFEDDRVDHFLPLAYTRPVYGLRLGMRTLLETAQDAFPDASAALLHARRYLAPAAAQEHDLLANHVPDGLDVLFLNGRYVAEEGPVLDRLRGAAASGEAARVFTQGDDVVAAWVPNASDRLVAGDAVTRATFEGMPEERLEGARLVGRLWGLLEELPRALVRDFEARTHGYNLYERPGADVRDGAILVGGERVYVAPGAAVRPGAVLNAEEGPIYVDRDALVMERAVITGPAYVGPKSIVMPGAHLKESALGYYVKANGEVLGSVIHSLSNKAHPGHLGDSYLGRWCNIGAGTDTSNLKNNYGTVDLYDYATGEREDTGRQFVGLFMGDHSKCGIGTMFNTGTVVGVSCNIFGAGFQPRHIPSFSWGGPAGFTEYRLDKALEVAEAVMARRDAPLTDAERDLLHHVFEATAAYRRDSVPAS